MLSSVAMGKTAGHKIKMLLAERKWKNIHLASAAGINLTTLGRWINDEQEPRVLEFLKVARALGVSLDWLVDPEQDYPPPSGPAEFLGSVEVPPPLPPSLEPKGNHLPAGKGVNGPTKRTRKR